MEQKMEATIVGYMKGLLRQVRFPKTRSPFLDGSREHMGGCQNYGRVLDPHDKTARYI